MSYRFSNRASALLINSISATSTTVILETNGGALFPFLAVGDVAQAALVSTTATEYVTITAVTGDNITIQRAKEGTAASSFAAGSRLELRLTAAVMDNFLQKTGGTLLGDIDFNGHAILNANYGGLIRTYEVFATLYRRITLPNNAGYDGTDNSIIIPDNDAQPYIRGRAIMTANYFDNIVFAAFIDVNNPPAHMLLCDGNNNTPDLRRRFLRGWNPGELGVGLVAGQDVAGTDGQGNHAHGFSTGSRILNSSNLPNLVFNRIVSNDTSVGQTFSRVINATVTYNDADIKPHVHDINTDGFHAHNVVTVPPYMVVAWVTFRFM